MKLVKTLLATTFALTAATTTFAASAHDKHQTKADEKVVVSTQELPDATSSKTSAATQQPVAAQPSTENAAESGNAPIQPAQPAQ